MSWTKPRTVVIIGSAVSGTAAAIRLMRGASGPCHVIMLEAKAAHRCGGVAYYAGGNGWSHVFNIQIGRMSVFREDVDDFLRWANGEADRTGWDAQWASVRFAEPDAAPRRIYQQYMRDRLERARRRAADGVTLSEAAGEAVEVEETADGGAVVTVRDYLAKEWADPLPMARVRADHVILAIGTENKCPPFPDAVVGHRGFVRDLYSKSGRERIFAAAGDGDAVIIGATLTGCDAAITLMREAGHTGRIHMVSRTGITMTAYPKDHAHAVITVRRPPFLDRPYGGPARLARDIAGEWKFQLDALWRDRPDIAPDILPERITKAWEPYIPELVAKIPAADLRALLKEHETLISTSRVRAMTYTLEIVKRAARGENPQLRMVTARAVDVAVAPDGALEVRLSREEAMETVRADLVISNFARETDFRAIRSELLQNLYARGAAAPHGVTGRGLEVTEDGCLVRRDGGVSRAISAMSFLREGDEIVRNGRTGAFAFNVAAIKNHSIDVPMRILSKFDDIAAYGAYYRDGARARRPDESIPAAVEAIGGACADIVGKIVERKILLLSALEKAERARVMGEVERLEADLLDRLRAEGSGGDGAMPERVFPCVVQAVLREMTDVSVTPRQLGDRLRARRSSG